MGPQSSKHRRGIIFIVSAPSGAGKTTISRAAVQKIAGLTPSISLTTRRPRNGEVEGIDYKFVSQEEFQRSLDADELAEWAQVLRASVSVTEAGNLLMMAPRARDTGNWMKAAQALVDGGRDALRAAQEKNAEKLFDAGAVLYEACNGCHRQYHWPPPPASPKGAPRQIGRASSADARSR